jgi:hypothetical protein
LSSLDLATNVAPLQQIRHVKETRMPAVSEITQIVMAATAFIAVIVSPLVSVYVARRQIRASVVSNSRQQWINSLRDAMAEFLAKNMMARTLNRQAHADESSFPRYEETLRLGTKIELLLNPNEPEHAEVIKLIGEILSTTSRSSCVPEDFDVQRHVDRIVELSQVIFKRAWDTVKRGH